MTNQNLILFLIRKNVKFSKYTIFEKNNIYNNKGEIFLRNIRFFHHYEDIKSESVLNKYAIWMIV